MEFHQLRYFVTVAEEGSFSRAAEKVRVAQPSLSQQILKLEHEAGQRLFDRLPRGVILTHAGEQLLMYARRILSDVSDARKLISEFNQETGGSVMVGVIPTIAPFLVPEVAQTFLGGDPGLSLEVIEDVTENLLKRLESGELDVAIISEAKPSALVHFERAGVEELVALLPAAHKLARRKRVSWDELEREKFLVLEEIHCLSGQVMRMCASGRARPNVIFKGAQLGTIARMVTAGLGVSIVPEMMARTDALHGRVYRSLREPRPRREIIVAWNIRRYRTRPASLFARCVTDLLRPGQDR